MSKPILCVDFDGVIHAYTSPWTNAETISDGPVPGALRWLFRAIEYFDIHIYSSRSKVPSGRNAMVAWFAVESLNEFTDDEAKALNSAITFSHEKPAAFLTIDDRAICFQGDWSAIDPAELLTFKPWNKRENQDKPRTPEEIFFSGSQWTQAEIERMRAAAVGLSRPAPMMMVDGLDDTAAEYPGHITWLPDGALMPARWVPSNGIPLDHTAPHQAQMASQSFLRDLTEVINRHSMENGCDTPDFILAEFLTTTLMAFDAATRRRTQWYGGGDVDGLKGRVQELEAQLQAEGEHTAAANAELDRIRDLNLRQGK